MPNHFPLGSGCLNLERVIRSAKIPVLVAAREFKPIRSFLLAFDGGASSLRAVHHAATHPLLKGLDCHLIMVGRKDHEHALALEHAATGLRGANFTVTADLLCGDPDEVIAAEVTKREIGLLVIAASLRPPPDAAPFGFFPLLRIPKSPRMTRRMGAPVSGWVVSGASFMLCLISKDSVFSPSTCGMVS